MDAFVLIQQYSAISVIKILYLYSNVIVYIVYSECGCLATDPHDCKDMWCYFFSFVEEHALNHTGLECPQDLSSCFTTQGRNEVYLFFLFLRLK